MKLRFYAALWAAKLSQPLLKITGHNGTDFPGMLALKLCPDFLQYIAKPDKIIAFTGTNGKTTTTNMVADALDAMGYHVLSNRFGSNIASGIASCLISGVNWRNRERYRLGVLEIDERSSFRIYPYVKPDIAACTNLARDSLFRNAHPHYMFDIINEAMPDTTTMVLNADDIISSRLKPGNPHVFFGIESLPSDRPTTFNLANDMRVCPVCHSKLEYSHVRYNHIGRVRCPRCGLASPQPDFLVTNVDFAARQLTVTQNGEASVYPLLSTSVFNIYNELTAITVLRAFGLSPAQIAEALSKTNVVASRYISETVRDIHIVSTMTKSWIAPACSAVFDYVSSLPEDKEIVIDIEDPEENERSSENLTYMYDTDFEFLNKPNIKNIVIVGCRAQDFYLRMLLAGIDRSKLQCVRTFAEIPPCLKLAPELELHILYDLHQTENFKTIRKLIVDRIEEVRPA